MKLRFAAVFGMLLVLTTSVRAEEPNETFETRTMLDAGVLIVEDMLTPLIGNYPDTMLGARDLFGQIYLVNDDSPIDGDGRASRLEGVPTNSGFIDFSVTGCCDNNFIGDHSESGSYEVFVDAYDFLGDLVDRFSEVRTLAPGFLHDFFYSDFNWIGGSYDVYIDNTLDTFPGDVDFFTFTDVAPGAQFSARTADPDANGIDTILAWFGDDGAVLGVNDDYVEGELVSRLEGTVPAGGMLTFAVSGFGDNNFLGSHFEDGTYELRLEIQSVPLAGDYNGNNLVDAADYVLWRKTLGQTGSGLPADGNNNNEIDPGDYTVWRANFGLSALNSGATAGLPSSAAVPEPASGTIFLLAVAALGWTRKNWIFSGWIGSTARWPR